MKDLKCPECSEPIYRRQLIFPHLYLVCQNCKSKLILTTKSSMMIGAIFGLCLIAAHLIAGQEKIYLIVLSFLLAQLLAPFLTDLKKIPENPSLLGPPKTMKDLFRIISMLIIIVVAIVLIYGLVIVIWYYSKLPSVKH